ncbi:MAG: rhodanese-like domain-containing protein [Blautia sp.]|jgi:rhodanese-related sulfurtransferase|uniref:rhodanese-like domain-containing protein n=1 Tax=Blautia sp. TaxID=1955243 RepID=UPI003D90277C
MRKISIQDNSIFMIQDGEEKKFDFVRYYKGYFPSCKLTAAGLSEHQFYVAGTDMEGTPHLYSSELGSVWTPVNLDSHYSLTTAIQYGDIVKILWDQRENQLFLASANGYLVTVPDCPKCVRSRKISDIELSDAWIEGREICIQDTAGQCIRNSIGTIVQYRCSWSFAKPHIGVDGLLLDFRDAESVEKQRITDAVVISYDVLDKFLEKYPRDKYLFFVCEHGYLADEAAREARRKGIKKAYTLGGTYMILNI